LLREDLPFEEWHGQKQLSYRHPAFPGDSAERWIASAFEQDYVANSSSIYRVIETSLMGFARLARMEPDSCLGVRKRQIEQRLRLWACMLPAIARHSVNRTERERARLLDLEVGQIFQRTVMEQLRRAVTPLIASAWKLRILAKGDMIQPRTIVTRYDTKRVGQCHRGASSTVRHLPECRRGGQTAPQEVGLADGG
jgi:hypothetical protein